MRCYPHKLGLQNIFSELKGSVPQSEAFSFKKLLDFRSFFTGAGAVGKPHLPGLGDAVGKPHLPGLGVKIRSENGELKGSVHQSGCVKFLAVGLRCVLGTVLCVPISLPSVIL